jgi:Small metal-binding protein
VRQYGSAKVVDVRQFKLIILSIALALSANFSVFAEDDHLKQAIKHAEEAGDASDANEAMKHLEMARTHAKTANDHIVSGISALDSGMDHGKMGHADMAKGAAKEAVKHFKVAND